MMGLFFMDLALYAKLREEADYENASGDGDIIVNIVVLQLPPKLSLSNLVKFEFL